MTEAPAPTRLLVIGIDAARRELLEGWMQDGTLPSLRALAARGVSGHMRGLQGFFIGSTWPSMYTGTNPANHGIHYLTQLKPSTYELYNPAQEEFVRRPPFWKALSDAGRRVAVLDVPLTRIDRALNGVHVVEWGGHDSLYGFSAHPQELQAEISSHYGAHPVGSTCDGSRQTADDYNEFIARAELGVERKEALTLDIMNRGSWDLLMQVFTEAHCTGHQCWHLHDPTHPAHDATIAARTGDPLRRVYQRIDSAIGRIVDAAGDVPIVVFSAHGMSHWYGAQFLLPQILEKLGASVALPAPPLTARRVARASVLAAWRALPEFVRVPVRRVRRIVTPASGAETANKPVINADVLRSKCFVHPNGLAVGGIRLNLVGREPHGVLQPGKDADEFVDWLTVALLEIVDERTGGPLISRVVRTSSIYSGEYLSSLPDLLVEWNDAVPTGSLGVANGVGARVRAHSQRMGVVEGSNDFARTGEHRPDGWLAAAGPGIEAGQFTAEPSLMDLAPTIAAILGVELKGVDGHPIERIARAPA